MQEFDAKWISNKEFYNIQIQNVFHKEMDAGFSYKPDPNLSNKHILFRKQLDIKKSGKYTVRISADDYYKLYINGRFVSMGPAPAYHFNYYYNTLDVTEYIVDGKNTIAVHTYYQGLINRVWVSGDCRHGLVFDLCDENNTLCKSDESWKTHIHTSFSPVFNIGYDTAFTERYDASGREVGFEKCDFDDSAWENAHFKTNSDYTLVPQPTRQLDIYKVKPKKTSKTIDGYLFDFGFEAVGYIDFSAEGNKGDVITIYCGEELNEDGNVRWQMRCNCKYEDQFVLSGNGTDVLNQYDYKAFRYLQLIVPDSAEIDLDSVCFTVRHYPFEQKKQFSTNGDSELDKIVKLCCDTIKYGVQECYVDCPTREKGQYLGDVSIAGLAHMYLTENPDMIIKALQNYCQSSFICKGLMTVAPGALMQEIADYSMQFPMQVLAVYSFTKDMDFLKEMYPYIQNVLDYFNAYRCDNGLIQNVTEKWNLVDWPENLRDNYDFEVTRPIGQGFHNVVNAFYCGMLSDIDEIRNILGMAPTGLKEQTFKAFINAFYDGEQKLFVDSIGSKHASLHSNVLPLLYNIGITEDNKQSLLNHIQNKRLTSAGTYMSFFTLMALKKQGQQELMIELIKDKGAWLNMINEGATTCFEAWGKDQKWNTSLFHPWSACPAIVLD